VVAMISGMAAASFSATAPVVGLFEVVDQEQMALDS
jgi:hypothetical protein